MSNAIHTSDIRHFRKLWTNHGGEIILISRTGEAKYIHPSFTRSIRANDRRKDVPAKLLSRLNALIRTNAANDPNFTTQK